jgi:hypothetical protein
MNIDKIIQISEFLDKQGIHKEADKLDTLVKVAQYVTLPSGYKEKSIETGNTLLDSMFKNLSQTSMGNYFADGRQYDLSGAYKSKFGPSGPLVLPTLTPTQQAKMEQEGNYEGITKIMSRGGMQLEAYSRLGNERLIGLATLLSQYNQPNVTPQMKKEFFSFFPKTVSRMITQDLSVRPLNQWDARINEYMTVLGKHAFAYMANFKDAIREALTDRAAEINYQNPSQHVKLLKDKDWKALASKYGVR